MAKATLINEAGGKVVVDVGSTEAQGYFGQGYQLMGASGKYEAPATAAPEQTPQQPDATLINRETGERVGVVSGSQDAQGYFGRGFVLETPEIKDDGNLDVPDSGSTLPSFEDLLKEQNTLRTNLLETMGSVGQRSEEEIALQGELSDLRDSRAADLRLSTERRGPRGFKMGEAAGILRQYQDDEQSLLTRLGFETEARQLADQARLGVAEARLSFIVEDIDMRDKLNQRLEEQKEKDRLAQERLTENARKFLDDMLAMNVGKSFYDLSETSQVRISELASQYGAPLETVINAMETSKSEFVLQRAKLNAEIRRTNQLSDNGSRNRSVPPSPGFFNYDIETDVRQTLSSLIPEFLVGDVTEGEIRRVIRTKYSENEVADYAIDSLLNSALGITPVGSEEVSNIVPGFFETSSSSGDLFIYSGGTAPEETVDDWISFLVKEDDDFFSDEEIKKRMKESGISPIGL